MAMIKRLSFRTCAAAVVIFSSSVYATPTAPVLVFPVDGASNVDTVSPVFRWDSSRPVPATTYNLLIASDTNFSINLRNIGLADTFRVVDSLFRNMRYYWRVAGIDSQPAWSTRRSFTTVTYVPGAPVLSAPADGATGQFTNPQLTWNATAGAAQYGVQVSTDPSFAASLIVNDSTPNTYLNLSGLESGRTCFWRVQARNIIGQNGPWTRWRFSTAQEDYSSWTYQKRLVLNTAGIQSQVYNMPVLVRLNSSTFGWLSQCASGGADVRFARPNGTALPYETERWKDNDSAELWVLLDVVKSSGLDTIIMYYGKAGATTRSDPYRVFDAYTGFSHVWHMDTTAPRDRTQNGCNASASTGASPLSWFAGKALSFSSGYVTLGSVKTTEFSSGATISAWVRFPPGTPNNSSLVAFSKSTTPAENRVSLGNRSSSTFPDTCRWITGRDSLNVANSFPADSTAYISATYRVSPDSIKVYRDGRLSGSKTGLVSPLFQFATAADSTLGVNFIGRNNYSGTSYSGYLDEVQVSRIARDSNWIKLAYRTQRFGQTALCYPPSIRLQPRDTTVAMNTAAGFSVTAAGNNLSYQWQRDNGLGWSDAPGVDSLAVYSFTTGPADTVSPNPRFQCIVSTPYESVTSAACTLIVCAPTVITTHPDAGAPKFAGETASFSVAAGGEQFSYRWQRSDSAAGGWSGWATAPGAYTANPYTFTVAATDTAARFRCIVSGMCSSSATSNAAKLTLCTHITIPGSGQPHDTTAPPVVAGTGAQFSVTASGGKYALSYQWQWRKLPDANWYPVTSGSGYTTPTYTLTSAQASDSGKEFRCLLSSYCENLPSDPAELAVCTPAKVTSDPHDTSVTIGQVARFCIAAEGAGLTYQWQKSIDTITYNNVTVGSGATSACYSFTTDSSDTGSKVRFHCIVTSTCNNTKDTSWYARVGVCFPANIAPGGQPDTLNNSTLVVVDSHNVTLKVIATGSGRTYQWQRWGGAAFGNITGATGYTHVFTAARANSDSGARFRCVVNSSGSCAISVTSRPCTLTVYRKAAITAHPLSDTVTGGDPASFSMSAIGGSSLGYQWEASRLGGAGPWTVITGAPYSGYNTGTLSISSAPVSDTNALFRCVVTASYYNANPPDTVLTSNPARLTVCYTPVIDTPPQPQTSIPPGDWADFRVAAHVTAGALMYQWEKSVPPLYAPYIPIPGATGRSYSFLVSTADTNTRYRCRTWNGSACAGSQMISAYALLTVCRVLTIDTQPASAGVTEGDSVTFSVSATGTGLLYQWQQRTKGSGTWSDYGSLGTADSLKLTYLSVADHDGSDFRCIVSAACGTPPLDTTDPPALLRVYRRTNAFFEMSDQSPTGPFDIIPVSGTWPLTVYFRDTAYGDNVTCYWNFGDTSSWDTLGARTTFGHTYDSVPAVRTYTVTLIAAGLGGRDTVTRTVWVYPASANPIVMSGRYLSATKVELTFSNYRVMRSAAPTPYVPGDGIKLWRRLGSSLPADTAAPAVPVKSYLLDTLKARSVVSPAGDTVFVDTVTVPWDTTWYSFMTVIKWDFGYFFTTPLDSGNGCRVLMRDTLAPLNLLTVMPEHLNTPPWDKVAFNIQETTTLDTARVDSVGLEWSIGSDVTPTFARTDARVIWWSAAHIDSLSVFGQFSDTAINSLFNTQSSYFYTYLRVLSRNKKYTDILVFKRIGRPRPQTPIQLTAAAHDANAIHLTWKWDSLQVHPDSVRVDSFRIWYAPDTAVPFTYTFDTAVYKPVTPDPSVSSGEVWVNQLAEKTWYHFGAQLFLDSSSDYGYNTLLWSLVSSSSVDSALTPAMADSRIRNTAVIASVSFNAETNSMQIFGQVDLMGYDSLFIGISYFPRDPAISKDSLIKMLADSTLPVNAFSTTIKVGWLGGFFNHTINLDQRNLTDNGSFIFDTTYYVLVWLKNSGARWWSPPTDSPSIATFRIPPFTWQTTRYVFNYPPRLPDTSYWINGRVRFVVPVGVGVGTVDARIQEFTPGDSLTPLDGFLPVGQGFSFIDRRNSNAFQIGIRCTIPPGDYTILDVRIYRYDSAARVWRVERSTAMDQPNSIVFISTNGGTNLRAPFIAMIDTLPPRISVLSDTIGALQAFTPVTDSCAVSDNIGNLKWWFYSARGEELPSPNDSATFTQDSGTVTTHIDPDDVHWDNGARAMLIADDGRLTQTANISRRVYRDTNTIISPALKWVPLRVTTALDDPSVSRLWQFVPEAQGQYDKRHVRLFRYLADASNVDSAANRKWVEYAPGRDSIFAIKPGRLLWIKTRTDVEFPLGRGVTPPLQKNDTVYLQANGWTDFALPHQFDMRIGDIFDLMNMEAPTYINVGIVPFFQWYQWSYDSSLFQTVYIDGVPGLNDRATLLSCRQGTGYTIYNPSSVAVALLIPPVSEAMSTYSAPSPQAKKAARTGVNVWAIKLMPKTDCGAGLGPVFCGCNEALRGSGWYPLPPTWSGLSVGVLDEKNNVLYGHRMLRSLQNNGASYLLAFRNDTASGRSISVTLERGEGFPASLTTAVYDPSTGATDELSAPNAAFSMSADAGATSCRWLFVGDATYVASAAKMLSVRKLAFDKICPNPARGLVRLRYSVPFALGKVRFTIFDISGRTLWSRTIEERTPLGGQRECQWDGTSARGRRVAAGVFIVRMEAFDEKGKSAGAFTKRLTFLP